VEEKKKLKFGHIGTPVVIELVEAKDPSLCRFGYKVGDTWEVNIWESSDLCGLAYHQFFPEISMLQMGGEACYKPSERDMVTRSCPDIRPGYRFAIKKKA
jgi:uncharacterized repeat protein (TIGR04076 family)